MEKAKFLSSQTVFMDSEDHTNSLEPDPLNCVITMDSSDTTGNKILEKY